MTGLFTAHFQPVPTCECTFWRNSLLGMNLNNRLTKLTPISLTTRV